MVQSTSPSNLVSPPTAYSTASPAHPKSGTATTLTLCEAIYHQCHRYGAFIQLRESTALTLTPQFGTHPAPAPHTEWHAVADWDKARPEHRIKFTRLMADLRLVYITDLLAAGSLAFASLKTLYGRRWHPLPVPTTKAQHRLHWQELTAMLCDPSHPTQIHPDLLATPPPRYSTRTVPYTHATTPHLTPAPLGPDPHPPPPPPTNQHHHPAPLYTDGAYKKVAPHHTQAG
jgi:hypothetical protein